MNFLDRFCQWFRLNPIIFKRFFSRKKANNKNDLLLTVVFIILIALTTAIVFRSSCEIYKYDKQIENFINNEWNKVFYLYLQNCFDFGKADITKIEKDRIPDTVINYIDSLASYSKISTNKGVRLYPEIITIKSENSLLPKALCYKFGEDYNYLVKYLAMVFDDTSIAKRPYLFIQNKLANKLKVKENDVVFIKPAGTGSSFSMPLQVKPIKEKTRIKCFIFQNYLFPTKSTKRIRLYFDSFSELSRFLLREILYKSHESQLTENFPVFLGIGEDCMGLVYDTEENTFATTIHEFIDENYDFIYFPSVIANMYKTTFSDSLKIVFEKNGNRYIYAKKIKNNRYIKIDKRDLFHEFLYVKHGFNNLDEKQVKITANLFEKKPVEKFFIEFDFAKNFAGNNIMKKQEKVFDFINEVKEYNINFHTQQKLGRFDNYRFFYYDKFKEDKLTKNILNKFDEFNIRWDSGRWKTIIDLNDSLKEGKRNIVFLLIINIIIFLLFLIIKLYLRLKIEFHTIGTIRCFGYDKVTLNQVYRIGYILQIVLGFIIGLFVGLIISLISGFSLNLILSSLGFILTSYLLSYLVILLLSSYFVVGYILNKLVHVEDIYGLIKYES